MGKRVLKVVVSTVLLWAAATVTEQWETAAAHAAATAVAHAQPAAPVAP